LQLLLADLATLKLYICNISQTMRNMYFWLTNSQHLKHLSIDKHAHLLVNICIYQSTYAVIGQHMHWLVNMCTDWSTYARSDQHIIYWSTSKLSRYTISSLLIYYCAWLVSPQLWLYTFCQMNLAKLLKKESTSFIVRLNTPAGFGINALL
jgi:hypothetical protein